MLYMCAFRGGTDLDLGVIRGDSEPDQAEGDGQAFIYIHLHILTGLTKQNGQQGAVSVQQQEHLNKILKSLFKKMSGEHFVVALFVQGGPVGIPPSGKTLIQYNVYTKYHLSDLDRLLCTI